MATDLAAQDEVPLKMLVPHYSFGALIGKGGATVTELQATTATRIKISQNGVFFPGTHERIALILGTVDGVISAVAAITEKIAAIPPLPQRDDAPRNVKPGVPRASEIILAIPSAAAAAVIGKGGETIKALQALTGGSVRVSAKENADLARGERYVTVGGTPEQLKTTTEAVIRKLVAENVLQYQSLSLQYDDFSTSHRQVEYDSRLASKAGQTKHTIVIPVEDAMVGFIVGKEGKSILDMQYKSGAIITVSNKGEYLDGTTKRTVTIVGTIHATQAAQILVQQKIDYAQGHPLQAK